MRRWGAAVAVLLAVAAPARAQEAPKVEVSYPTARTVTDSAYLTVEGWVKSPAVDEIEIVVNGEDRYRAGVRHGVFAEEVRLEVGLNTVRVEDRERQVFLLGGTEAPPPGFARVYGHHGLDDGCRECHTIDDEGKLDLAGEREEICLWCHGDLVRDRAGKALASVHEPVAEGKCLLCHTPHLSTKKGMPAEKPPACAECHGAVTERLKSDRFVHGPMNLGDCRLCHTVHGSAEPGLLVRPATALCTGCHSDALPPPGTAAALQPHAMIPQGQCVRCHEAHSSPNPRMLRQPAGRLCQECHPSKTRSFHEAKGFSIYICSKCHDLHRPTQPHLIMDASRSLCLQCHDFAVESAFTHSFVREGRCFLCHTFHEASLPGDVATTCLGCHRDTPNLPAVHRDVPFAASRCTGCHLPHQSRRPKLLQAEEHTPFRKRDCGPCHRERAAKIGSVYRPLCVDCHKAQDLAVLQPPPPEIHPPFRDQDCSVCHRSHTSEAPNQLVASGTKLCLGCHRKLKKGTILTPKSSHADFLEGRCGACHAAHYAEYDALLRKPPGALCSGCHEELVRSAGAPWGDPHPPVAEGKCRVCHRPHTSLNPSLLRVAMPQGCRPCHAGLFASLDGPAVRSRHKPVQEGNCPACHAVHGSAVPGLLPADGVLPVCAGCHRDLKGSHHVVTEAQLAEATGGAPAKRRGCLACHEPHAAETTRLLRPSNSPVCKGCHKT